VFNFPVWGSYFEMNCSGIAISLYSSLLIATETFNSEDFEVKIEVSKEDFDKKTWAPSDLSIKTVGTEPLTSTLTLLQLIISQEATAFSKEIEHFWQSSKVIVLNLPWTVIKVLSHCEI